MKILNLFFFFIFKTDILRKKIFRKVFDKKKYADVLMLLSFQIYFTFKYCYGYLFAHNI